MAAKGNEVQKSPVVSEVSTGLPPMLLPRDREVIVKLWSGKWWASLSTYEDGERNAVECRAAGIFLKTWDLTHKHVR